MKIEQINKLMREVKDFLEYHSLVLENGEPYKSYCSAVTSVSMSFGKCCIQLNEEAFDRVIKNPTLIMDYGYVPGGITTIVSSSETMHSSFEWNSLEIMTVKDLDISKITPAKTEVA